MQPSLNPSTEAPVIPAGPVHFETLGATLTAELVQWDEHSNAGACIGGAGRQGRFLLLLLCWLSLGISLPSLDCPIQKMLRWSLFRRQLRVWMSCISSLFSLDDGRTAAYAVVLYTSLFSLDDG